MKTINTLTALAFFLTITIWTGVAVLYTGIADSHSKNLARSVEFVSSSHADLHEQGLGTPGYPNEVADLTSTTIYPTERVVSQVTKKSATRTARAARTTRTIRATRAARSDRAGTDTNTDVDTYADACENGLGTPGCPKTASDRTGTVVHLTNGVVSQVSNSPTARTARTARANSDIYADACENGLGSAGCPKTASDRTGTVVHIN